MDFRCGAGNESLNLGCYQGVCVYDPEIGETCKCNPGFVHDQFGYFHFPNCSVPSGFINVFFICYTTIFFLLSIIVLRKIWTMRQIRSTTMRYIASLVYLWCFATWLHVLCTYLEGGLFESAIFFFMLLGIIGYYLVTVCVSILMRPIARKAGWTSLYNRVNTRSRILLCAQCIFSICSLGVAMALCREPNPRMYNLVVFINVTEQAAAVFFGAFWTFTTSGQLKKMLPAEADNVHKQLTIFRQVSLMMMGGSMVSVATSVTILIYHNFLFMWITWIVLDSLLIFTLYFDIPLLNALMGKSSTAPNPTKSKEDKVDSEPTTTHDPNTVVLPVLGLGIQGPTAFKWKRTKGDDGNALSRISEAQESRVVTVVDTVVATDATQSESQQL